jgi:ketosteroid isomerase-like protein
MWAQLIKMRLKPGSDTGEMTREVRAAEQSGSGLVRSVFMHDQSDPNCVYTLVIFESEEKARAREQDPRRQAQLQKARSIMAEIFDGSAEFTDLAVDDEWTDAGMSEHPNVDLVRSGYEAVARGDMAAFAALLHDDVVWHESTPGFEGSYHGPDETLAMLGRVFYETGMELKDLSIRKILADDDHAVVLLASTMTRGDREHTGEYVDVYSLRAGKVAEHRHLPVDPNAEEEFFAV